MRMLVFGLLLAPTLLSACGGCSPNARSRVTIGTGEQDFVPLDEEAPTWDLVHGPQGGWHVLVGLQATGLNATEIVVSEMVGTLNGEEVARNDSAWLTFRCDAEVNRLESWNTFLILRVEDHCPLDGQDLTVDVAVEDTRGRTATDQITATIRDPEAATCD